MFGRIPVRTEETAPARGEIVGWKVKQQYSVLAGTLEHRLLKALARLENA